MKAKYLAIVSVTALAILLIGAYAANVLSAPPYLKLKAKWKPALYVQNTPIPDPWKVEIYFAPPRPVTDIDIYSLRLEGNIMWEEEFPPLLHPLKDRLVVSYDGHAVYEAALMKLTHTAPGTYVVYLEMTGYLNDGITSFRGQGSITLIMDATLPP